MRRGIVFVFIAVIIVAGSVYWTQYVKMKEFTKEAFLMDTWIQITVYHANAEQGRAALQAAFEEYDRVSVLTNRFPKTEKERGGDVHRVNENAGIGPVKVSPDTVDILQQSLYYCELSQGAFDITVGPLMDLWGFGGESQRVPTDREIAQVLPLVDYRLVEIEPEALTVYLPEPGMSLDLGGVAKGYATDKAVHRLREVGIKHALINAGGNIYCIGAKPDGSLWRVGIRDPRADNGMLGVVAVQDISLVSSGDNERYFEENGVHYSHLLDPSTGKQARELMQTTVMAASSTEADILNKPLFVLGPARAQVLAKDLPIEGALMITPDKEVIPTGAFIAELSLVGDAGYWIKAN